MNDIVYIDADLIAYKASAAAEERTIHVKLANGSEYTFKNRTEFKNSIPDSKRVGSVITDVQTPEPVENIYHTVKVMAQNIADKAGCEDYKLVLSGKNNFRDDIPLPKKYKGNRVDTLRPILLPDARQYIQHVMKGIVTDGYEADDFLSMMVYEGVKSNRKIIQATTDKDARQCNGWLFNWDKDTAPRFIKGNGFLRYEDSDVYGEGHLWLLYQVLQSDPADNYRGADISGKKFGVKAAFDILSKAKSIKEAYSLLYNQYLAWYPDVVEYVDWTGTTQHKTALEIAEMYWQCARMLRYENDNLTLEEMLTNLALI